MAVFDDEFVKDRQSDIAMFTALHDKRNNENELKQIYYILFVVVKICGCCIKGKRTKRF